MIQLTKEDTKDFNAMLHNKKDMPKIQIVTDTKTIEKYGGNKWKEDKLNQGERIYEKKSI